MSVIHYLMQRVRLFKNKADQKTIEREEPKPHYKKEKKKKERKKKKRKKKKKKKRKE